MVRVDYFTDVLCIWAYTGQVRIDELQRAMGDGIALHYRFMPLFGAAIHRITEGWENRGGFNGFNQHLRETARESPHVVLHPDLWLVQRPATSSNAHLYIKAVQLLQEHGELAHAAQDEYAGRTVLEEYIWRVRCGFFADGRNIAETAVLDNIASLMGLPVALIHSLLLDGEAHAQLHLDYQASDKYMIPGSPTFIFNDGRQRLYGNVGYRIIEANIRELLRDPLKV